MLVPTLRPTANSSGFPLLVALGFLLVALAAVLRSPNDLGWSTRTVVQLPKISRVRCFAETSPRNAPSVPSLPFEGEVKRRSALVAGLTAPITPLSLSFAEGFFPQTAQASLLTAQQPVSDPRELLRDALPINNKPIRKIQKEIFAKITEAVRVPNVKMSEVQDAVSQSQKVISKEKGSILKDVQGDVAKKDAQASLASIETKLGEFQEIIDTKDKQEIPIKQQEILSLIERIETDMVAGFPFKIPDDYQNMPLLKGRAKLEMKVTCTQSTLTKGGTMTIVVDGFNAPVTAGNFVDLANRKFYDGMKIQRSDGFVVQSGDPGNKQTGFIDPVTKQLRTVPLEIMVQGDKAPVYEATLDDVGRFKDLPILPFNAFGTLAMARNEFEANSASSQFFFLLKESELTPSGTNVLDGRYGVFGYITEGKDLLKEIKQGDIIDYVKVVDGLQSMVNLGQSAPAEDANAAVTPSMA